MWDADENIHIIPTKRNTRMSIKTLVQFWRRDIFGSSARKYIVDLLPNLQYLYNVRVCFRLTYIIEVRKVITLKKDLTNCELYYNEKILQVFSMSNTHTKHLIKSKYVHL